jgi:predicted nucleotidyltransferase component of viral defense system
MPLYDKKTLLRQAQELGFVRDTFEKMLRLVEIFHFMSNDPLLSTALALKGGTAINLTIFDLPRLSMDIDLDYAFANSRDEMMRDREMISSVLRRYMAAEGYELSAKSKSHHSLDSLVFSFLNAAGVKDNIKIEINYSLRCHALPLAMRPISTMDVFKDVSVLSVDTLEIFASKIVALLDRTAARDLYDINNMVALGIISPTNSDILRKCVVFYAAIASDEAPMQFDVDRIYSLTNYKIRTDLQPVLRKKERFDLSSAQQTVKGYLNDLLTLKVNELEFLRAFRNKQYKPELLFDGEILERVQLHPMALWKMQNRA